MDNVITPKKIVDFFLTEGESLFCEEQRDALEAAIELHIKYNTIKVLIDEKGITGAVRWNWRKDNSVDIWDIAIRKDIRGSGLVDYIAKKCLKEDPRIIGLHFQDKGLKRKYYKEASYYLKKETKHEHSKKLRD